MISNKYDELKKIISKTIDTRIIETCKLSVKESSKLVNCR
ncbi:protein of unknown function [Candidatus Nitrosotalea okcheonensis]|uniref:Uncharacterized protein n=1 Tax=Candidatus Nitrosotalea okcheonensis TaxID=1903276 RepID=A0A2H1FF09_9ARCH|nr:protein of unknown function [Candidatus Nitrosotalea okcheonensis]